jgi:hypothetical protein
MNPPGAVLRCPISQIHAKRQIPTTGGLDYLRGSAFTGV